MVEAVESAVLFCGVAGLLAGLVVLVVVRDFWLALKCALDLWQAAGLLQLAVAPQWSQTLAAGAVIVVRQLVVVGLSSARATREVARLPRR